MKKVILLFSYLIASLAFGQSQSKPAKQEANSFVEMQRQFDQFKKTHDLKNEKGWKYYKRWEQEALMHAMPNGELADPSLVNAEYIRVANENTAINSAKAKGVFNINWNPEGPTSVEPQFQLSNYGIGRINCIAYHPNNPAIYWVGVAQGGVWKTTDNGVTWTALTDNLPITRISDIAVNPNNVNEIYIAVGDFEYIDFGLKLNGRKRNTHYGLGVYKTLNGGVTWQPTGLAFNLNSLDASLTRKIIIHPTLNNKLVAATSNGIYVSNNSGTSWTQILDSLFWDLAEDPANPNVLYAATGYLRNANIGYASVMKSTDFGATWTQLPTGIPPTNAVQRIKLCIAPSNSNIIYALCVDINRGMYGLYKSSNAGVSWIKKFDSINLLDFYSGAGIGGQGTYDLVLMVPPQDTNKVYAGGINIWGSNDGGATFEPVTNKYISSAPDIHVDQHFLSYNPITQNVFICNDGGVYRAPILYTTTLANLGSGSPFPTTWTNISAGLQITAFYRVSSDKATTNQMVAGAQDNSTYYYDGTGWNNISGGDGMDNYVNSAGDYIVSSQFGNFFTQTTSNSTGFNIPDAEWTAPVTVDDITGDAYFGGVELYQSPDLGINRNVISNFAIASGNGFNEPPITSIAAAGNRLYITKRPLYPLFISGYCYTSSNGGNAWSDITNGLPDSLYFTSVEVNPSFPLEAYVTCAGFSLGNKVFRTIDGGTTWTNISYNLPNLPVNMVKCIDPASHLMMVACDVGVYYFESSSNTWQLYNTGLPNVIVSDIEVNQAANKIMVSTFGRGIWSTAYNQFIAQANSVSKIVSESVIIYPNPAKEEIFIQSNQAKFVKVFDLMGSLVLQSEIKNGKLNISTLKEKSYLVTFYNQSNNQISSTKLIKQ
jgi:photosystem II stability/assembly factor-like uncharacterized protein